MGKAKENVISVSITLAVVGITVGILLVAIFSNDDARLGFKIALNDTGLFNIDLEEERRPRPPKIGMMTSQVESYCIYADKRHSFETSQGTTITLIYNFPQKPGCQGTFTFFNDKLSAISR